MVLSAAGLVSVSAALGTEGPELSFDEEQEQLRRLVAGFLADHADEDTVREAMASPLGFDADRWQRMADELGLPGLLVPEALGGAGLGAVELGIATQLCEPDELLPAAFERARRLAAKPLGALRYTKRLLLATRDEQVRAARAREDEAFGVRVGSPENVEAIRAFVEKREADFSSVPAHDKPR